MEKSLNLKFDHKTVYDQITWQATWRKNYSSVSGWFEKLKFVEEFC